MKLLTKPVLLAMAVLVLLIVANLAIGTRPTALSWLMLGSAYVYRLHLEQHYERGYLVMLLTGNVATHSQANNSGGTVASVMAVLLLYLFWGALDWWQSRKQAMHDPR